MKRALALTVFLSASAFACEVNLPQRILVMGQGGQGSAIESQNCDPTVAADVQEILTNVEGKITAFQLVEMLNQKGTTNVDVKPHLIHVDQLASLVRDQLQLPPGVQVKSTQAESGPNFVALSGGDKVQVECASCLFGLAQPLKLSVHGFDGTNTTIMARADFRKMVRAFKVIAPVTSFSEIAPGEVLKEAYVEAIPHTDLVTDLSQVRFYKTNKPLKPGALLKFSDLNAVNLVRAGLKTEVILENTLVRIKTQGISRSNGTLGDLVEVFHQQKNKKYLGKVIDHNKVLVEL